MRFTVTALLACTIAFAPAALAQQGPVNGMRPADLRTHAITNATVIPAPGEKIEGANILIRDGVIIAVGPASDVAVPAGAWVWSADGLTVYAGLIESALLISPGDRAASAGAHWNPQITPEIRMNEQPPPSSGVRSELRSLGFTTAAVFPSSGILRGTGNVIALADQDEHVLAYREDSFMGAAFDRSRRGSGISYPGSLMGSIALFRQTMFDAQWHAQCRQMYAQNPEGLEPPMRADALAALKSVITGHQRVFFDSSDEQYALRAARLAEEFDLDMVLLGSGYEFRRLREVAALGMPIVVPVSYPERPNVNTLATAERTSLREMVSWEQAPTNARRLVNEGVEIALTTHRLRRKNEFFAKVRSAIENGLTEDQALAALTTSPAKLFGVDSTVGTIAPGKAANLVVVKGGLFEKDAKIRDVWVNGRRHEISAEPDITFVGKGVLHISRGDQAIDIEFDTTKRSVAVVVDEKKKERAKNVTVQRDHLSFIIDASVISEPSRPRDGQAGYARLSGVITADLVAGSGVMPDGSTFTFTIEPTELTEGDDEGETQDEADDEDETDDEQDPVAGVWNVLAEAEGLDEPIAVTLTLTREEDGSLSGTSSAMGLDLPISDVEYDTSTGEIQYNVEAPGGMSRITGVIEGDRFSGTYVMLAGGEEMSAGEFSGSRAGAGEAVAKKDEPKLSPPPEELVYPLGEYGFAEPPQQEHVLIRGATIWTSGPDGIIPQGDLYIKDGRIEYVGPTVSWAFEPEEVRLEPGEELNEEKILELANRRGPNEPRIINARGKHITPGMIDAHSHTGIESGINEFSHVNTAEVRISDVIDPDDINWYRQLAGGLTAANQLHGSANPIGGQNSIVKLKWGAAEGANAMRVPDARPGIKFALGENVVRSQSRYPNSRMGVETVMRDAFTAAREYEAKRRGKPGTSRPAYPRRPDLQLDALVDILNDERDIHCHSYRQDEILALMRVAEDIGFRVDTFQHILEGYKVADVMKQHGANASAFSDWWAYKVEVMDAIPYAGAIMHDVGITVSFNSDSSELARRMNTEAAKAVRYGNVPPEQAIKFVTLNPAIQLGIDHRTGSLERGKDADFVIWSGDPLSTYSRAEQTWIEGAVYFSIEKDRELREHVQRERQRLIQKILAQAHGDVSSQKDAARENASEEGAGEGRRGRRPRLMQTVIDQHIRTLENMARMGIDPDEIRPGDCGCNDWWYGLR